MSKAKIKLQTKLPNDEIDMKNQMLLVKVKDKTHRLRYIPIHGYLMGIELANKVRRENEDHSMVLCVGGVGSGKTTIITGMAGVNATLADSRFSLNNMVWTTDKFRQKYHNEKMIYLPIVWDESIDGVGKLNNSTKGEKLKKTVVTGRFQLHTSYLLVDEVVEFHPKLVRMAHVLIRVMRFGTKRGFFEAYTDKRKIKFIYDGFKYYGKSWSSPEIRKVLPDCRGKFPDYTSVFFEKEDYNKQKLEETREEATTDLIWRPEKVIAYGLWKEGGITQEKISEKIKIPYGTLRDWIKEFKKLSVVD